MKSEDIKKAYEAVKADAALKEKLLHQTEENENASRNIRIRKGGTIKRAAVSVCAAAAVFAAVFAFGRFTSDNKNIEIPYPSSEESCTAENTSAPADNTAQVTVKLVDSNGNAVKNMRIDYFPVVKEKVKIGGYDALTGENVSKETEQWFYDEENMHRSGTIPITYGEPVTLELEYGTYSFIVSDALANDIIEVNNYKKVKNIVSDTWTSDTIDTWTSDTIDTWTNDTIEDNNYEKMKSFMFKGFSGNVASEIIYSVDEFVSELVITAPKYNKFGGGPYISKGEIIVQDSAGNPLSDCTVILKPVNGVMSNGYSDIYGGYVLPLTDENGSSVWTHPIEGEYIVTVYKEQLHTADIPISEPVVIAGDNTFTYKRKESVLNTYKIYTAQN